MDESRGLVAAAGGQQNQGKQIASNTAQQTLQMMVFPHNGHQRKLAAIPMRPPEHELWPQHSTWQTPLSHQRD